MLFRVAVPVLASALLRRSTRLTQRARAEALELAHSAQDEHELERALIWALRIDPQPSTAKAVAIAVDGLDSDTKAKMLGRLPRLPSAGGHLDAALGLCLLNMKQPLASVAALETAIRVEAASPGWWRWLASAHLMSGRFRDAVQAIDEYLVRDPAPNGRGLRGAAAIYHAAGRLDRALFYYRQLADRAPQPGYLLEYSTVARATGHPWEALVASRRAVELSPDDQSAWAIRSQCLLAAAQPEAALRAAHRGLEVQPRSVENHLAAADALAALAMPHEASEWIETLLSVDKSPKTVRACADRLGRIGRTERAVELCREVAIATADTQPLADAALHLSRDKQHARALELLDEIPTGQEADGPTWAARGGILADVRDRDGAIAAFYHAVTARPQEFKWRRRLVTLLLEVGRIDEALVQASEAQEAHGGVRADTRALYARALAAAGHPDEAIALASGSGALTVYELFLQLIADAQHEQAFGYLASEHGALISKAAT